MVNLIDLTDYLASSVVFFALELPRDHFSSLEYVLDLRLCLLFIRYVLRINRQRMQSWSDLIIALKAPFRNLKTDIFVSIVVLPFSITLNRALVALTVPFKWVETICFELRSLIHIMLNAGMITGKEIHYWSSLALSWSDKLPPLTHILAFLSIFHYSFDWSGISFILTIRCIFLLRDAFLFGCLISCLLLWLYEILK